MADRRNALIPWVLRAIAEGGWVTVLYAALVVGIEKRLPVLGPIELALLVGGGMLLGTFARRRFDLAPSMLIVGAFIGGALGWLASPDVRAMFLVNPGAALGIHVSGWLGAIAALRGLIIQRGSLGAQQSESLLRSTLPGLAIVWAFGTVASPAVLRPVFVTDALWGTLAFIVAAVMGLGMARLLILQAALPDPRVRRMWRLLVVVIAFAVVPIAVPIAVLSGIPVSQLLIPFAGPLNTIGWILTLPLQFVVAILEAIFRPLGPGVGRMLDQIGRAFGIGRPAAADVQPGAAGTALGIVLGLVTIAFILFLMFLVAHWFWGKRRDDTARPVDEEEAVEHTFVVPPRKRPAPSRPRRATLRRSPVNAVEAYLGALAELETHAAYARGATETPGDHARRVRLGGLPGAREFGRLAAAYQLARYGQRDLSVAEDKRSVVRLQRIRRLVRSAR